MGQCVAPLAEPPDPPPYEYVECNVFDDAYTNLQGPSDAIFISGRIEKNWLGNAVIYELGEACIPGTQFGFCHKWFGRCKTAMTHQPVRFFVLDNRGRNVGGSSDAIYIPPDGDQACIPDGTASGTCAAWFGHGVTDDGRSVKCSVFDDGYAKISNRRDAVSAYESFR